MLNYAIEPNLQKNGCVSTVSFIGSREQPTTILFTVAPAFALIYDDLGSLIIKNLEAMLSKVSEFVSITISSN